MEHIKHAPQEDQSAGMSAEHSAEPHTSIYESPEGTFEEVSFLFEPIEEYKDDLTYVERALAHKRTVLAELEEKAAAHTSAGTSALDVLRQDIAQKVEKAKGEVQRLEILRNATQQRLTLALHADRQEREVLDRLPTDGPEN